MHGRGGCLAGGSAGQHVHVFAEHGTKIMILLFCERRRAVHAGRENLRRRQYAEKPDYAGGKPRD